MKKAINFLIYISIFFTYFIINYLASGVLFSDVPFLSIIVELFFVLCIVVYLFKDIKLEWIKFTKHLDKNISTAIRYWMVGVTLMTITNLLIMYLLPSVDQANENAVRTLITHIPLTMFISVVIIAPIIEELIFRKTIHKLINTKWLFVAVSTFAFSAGHVVSGMESWLDLTLIITYGWMGLVLALAYLKTNSIFTSITLHLFHNLVTFSLFMLL